MKHPTHSNPPKHPRLLVSSLVVVALLVGAALAGMPAVSSAAIAPPVSGIEITKYEEEITQEAGTSADYTVAVKNVGSLDLDPIYLSSSKITASWFESEGRTALEFNKTGELSYTLTLPDTVKGIYVFTVTAVGSYGEVRETDTKPVLLTVVEAEETAGEHTTQQTTQQLTQEATQGITAAAGASTGGTTTSTESASTIPASETSAVPAADLTEFIAGKIENPMYQLIGLLFVIVVILAAIRLKIKRTK
jgi:hypothetical protein